jgi:hypothetical protein
MAREWEGVDLSSVPADYRTYAPGGVFAQGRGGYVPAVQEDAINPEDFLKSHSGFLIGDPDSCIQTLE